MLTHCWRQAGHLPKLRRGRSPGLCVVRCRGVAAGPRSALSAPEHVSTCLGNAARCWETAVPDWTSSQKFSKNSRVLYKYPSKMSHPHLHGTFVGRLLIRRISISCRPRSLRGQEGLSLYYKLGEGFRFLDRTKFYCTGVIFCLR